MRRFNDQSNYISAINSGLKYSAANLFQINDGVKKVESHTNVATAPRCSGSHDD